MPLIKTDKTLEFTKRDLKLGNASSQTILAFAALVSIHGLVGSSEISAHPGGLAADGCHNDRKNGRRHCHRSTTARSQPKASKSSDVFYANCAAARAAGAAPVYRGEPGYGKHLDRDGDGIGCE